MRRKTVFQDNMIDIKQELKQSIKKTYSSEIGELVTRIEILADLFQELQHTLDDLDKERSVGKFKRNLVDLTLNFRSEQQQKD